MDSPVASSVEPLEGRVLLATHLAPSADTFVRNNAFQDANYGASPFLWVKTSTPGGGDSRNAFLRFNVGGGIDANSIGTATLYLSGALQSPTTAPITAGIFGVADNSWQEGNGNVSVRRRGGGGGGGSQLTGTSLGDGYDTDGGIDWNNQPATSAGPVATAVVDRDTFNTYAFDVTQYVRSQVAGGDNNISMAVKGNEATTAFMRFISSNFDGPGKPQLVISRSDDSFVRANISASGISAGGGATHTVVVSYAADVPIDLSKFGTDDIRVRRADGAPLDVVNLSADQPFNSASVNVTYVVALPGGTADRSDNGVYTVELPRGAARDVAGNENAASFGSFRIAIDDAQAPSAAVVAGPVTAPGGNSYTFTVNYTDDTAIDAESVNVNNVAVTGPNNTTLPVTQVTVTPDADNGQVAATYTVVAPNGEWDASDNGTYSIVPRNNQVRDTAGHDLSESLATFQVSIGPADDESPQVTSVSAPNVTAAGGNSHDVTVIYSDNVAIDVASIDATDITVSGPRGNLAVASPVVSQPTDGSPRTVTYRVTPPDGSWDAADNGAYTITVNAGAVRDTSGHGVAAATGSFEVNATGNDGTPPTATVSAAPDVTSAGGDTYSFTVVYGDNVAVRANSLDAGDVTVAPEGGGGALQVVGVAPAPNNDASQIAVTYTVAARGGSWDGGDNGRYVITLNGNQVADTSGNVIGGPVQIGAFQVAVPGTDNQRPVPTISALNVTSAGAGAYSFTVTYADNVGIRAETVGIDDVSVAGPGGPLAVTSTQTLPSGTDLVVTYFVTPPGNSWDAADNGAYNITVGEGAVTDTSGNGNVGRSQAFHVNVNGGDQFGPQGTVTAPDVAAPGQTATVTIKWQDDTAVRSNTIDVNDIIVSRGDVNGPRLRVISADVTPKNNGPSVNAVYTVEALGGAWDPSDNGTYVITIVPDEVRDTADGGHPAQAGSGAFSVSIPDNASPTATITAPNITESTGERQKITVSYNDDVAIDITSIQGSSDLIITGPAGVGRLLPVSVTTSSSTNDPTIVVTYEIDPPGGTWDVSDNGTYTISVAPGSVKDAAKNAVTGSGTFTVNVAGEPPLSGPSIVAGFTIEAMVTQEDGKVILVGRQASPNVPGGFQSVIQRRDISGILDAGFGNGGQVLGDPSSNVVFYAVALTNNGIVVAGSQDGHWVLARYNLVGQPDVTFGQGGRTVTTFNANNESAYALAVDPRDGKLVVGGGSPAGPEDGEADQNFAFARYLPGGALDVTFGQSGLQLFDINGEDVVGAITVRDDGRVVAAGSSGTNISLFQLSPNGEADATFSTDGYFTVPGLKARVDTGFFVDHSQALAIQDGKILVGNHNDAGDFGIVRVNPDGTVDPTFGQDGIATIDIGGTNDDVDSIVLQPTGEILAVGTSNAGVGGAGVTAVAALDRNGGLLTGWNAGGKLTFDPNITPAAGRELHVGDLILRAFGTRQSDGRLVVGSSDRSPAPSSSAFRKIVVPGVSAEPIGEVQGTFGVGSTSRGRRFVYVEMLNGVPTGKTITFSLKGNATGRVYLSGDKLNLRIEDLSGGAVPCSVVIKVKGGDGRVALGDVICTGGLKAFNAKTADVSGTMYIPGMAGKLALGNLTGTVAASGAITSLLVSGLDGAKVLSGANLGSDAKLGGTGTGGDTFGQGFIGALKVAGAIKGSTVAAGLNPIDEIIGDEDDIVVGGVAAPGGPFSIIRSITAKGGADDASQFIAGGFKTVKLPKRVDPATDPQARFRVM